ncbi:MAG: ABC transporter substrate-binding protein [Anaerolineales bacterium]|nr:ABC transporter substrate-binding protein [Anaerolineales bacterium]
MGIKQRVLFLIWLALIWLLAGCGMEEKEQLKAPSLPAQEEKIFNPGTPPKVSRVLSVCLGEEPDSLFYYREFSFAADIIRQAIYDGPVERVDYRSEPVILSVLPSRANGGVQLEPTLVEPGEVIIDAQGDLTLLTPGITYRPAGCESFDCSETYQGNDPVELDQVVIDFAIIPGVTWSDGSALTAADSVFSYQTARELFGDRGLKKVQFTASYQAVDQHLVRWKGVPGFHSLFTYESFFFIPLPVDLWGNLSTEQLLIEPRVNRTPIGWGPYQIEEWVSGDHISLTLNPYYHRRAEQLPVFDRLVFRFVEEEPASLAAFTAGECDIALSAEGFAADFSRLQEFQTNGEMKLVYLEGGPWEQIVFGIDSLESHPAVFGDKKVRQAAAQCINRQAIVRGNPQAGRAAAGFIPGTHPTYNPETAVYAYQPYQARELLESAGWVDHDGDPATPRIARGVEGVEEGIPLEVKYYLFASSGESPAVQQLVSNLEDCGFKLKILALSPEELLAPGPDGPVFGRRFDLAQFAWTTGDYHLCTLFTSREIPGPYPDYPRGWGGANAAGFADPRFDEACQLVKNSLPDDPQRDQALLDLQSIFADELPALPLFFRRLAMVIKPQLDGIESGAQIPLWNLEIIH